MFFIHTYQIATFISVNFRLGNIHFCEACVCFTVIIKKWNNERTSYFVLKLKKLTTDTYKRIKSVYGEDAMSRSRGLGCFSKFHVGKESTKYHETSGHPCSSRNEENVQHVRLLMTSCSLLWLEHSTKMWCIGFWNECGVWRSICCQWKLVLLAWQHIHCCHKREFFNSISHHFFQKNIYYKSFGNIFKGNTLQNGFFKIVVQKKDFRLWQPCISAHNVHTCAAIVGEKAGCEHEHLPYLPDLSTKDYFFS